MFETWLAAFVIFLGVIVALATGLLLRGRPVSGTCGGLNRLGMKKDCPVCGAGPRFPEQSRGKDVARPRELYYDATATSRRAVPSRTGRSVTSGTGRTRPDPAHDAKKRCKEKQEKRRSARTRDTS